MSLKLMGFIYDCNMPTLKTDKEETVLDTTLKAVLLALADCSNEEGEGAYPSGATLCNKTQYSKPSVCNALNALRTNGFIKLVGKSQWDTNNYTISINKIGEFLYEDSKYKSTSKATLLPVKSTSKATLLPEVKPLYSEESSHFTESLIKPLTKPLVATQENSKESYEAYLAESQRKEVERKQRVAGIVNNSFLRTGIDVGSVREDLRDTARVFCNLFKIAIPSPNEKKGSPFAFWTMGLEELKEACGEFGTKVIEELYKDWTEQAVNGVPRFVVNSPKSLVKMASGKAGEIRRRGDSNNDTVKFGNDKAGGFYL